MYDSIIRKHVCTYVCTYLYIHTRVETGSGHPGQPDHILSESTRSNPNIQVWPRFCIESRAVIIAFSPWIKRAWWWWYMCISKFSSWYLMKWLYNWSVMIIWCLDNSCIVSGGQTAIFAQGHYCFQHKCPVQKGVWYTSISFNCVNHSVEYWV